MKLTLVKQVNFGTMLMDFYMDMNGEPWATREQIGTALGYGDPIRAISKVHERHEERFKDKSVVVKLTTTDEKDYSTTLYNARGITEICRWARTEKSDEFFDWVADIIDELRRNGVVVSDTATHEQVKFNISTFMANLDEYNITKLYNLVEEFLSFHREKKTRLPFERSNKKRHGNKKLKNHIESMEEIRKELVTYLDVKIQLFNNSNQAGLAQEYVRIKGLVEWKVENMRYRSAACK
ncbi:hypothetical protein BC351_10715 [Paenibacillus ferrarius]|uniref:Bro-N domain-containing protein n=1 Tax=Paenibacillus ferrarius TaxID=1469647 RepID=A0A1V4H909_9BACL|nr:BRO family protein [Paenibacillus ferrarius]OPH47653.1 hypothetical protein BC351_10715 [Paenibacillus ferrarius]